MATYRSVLALVATVPAAGLAFIFWLFNGYVEDGGSPPANTLPIAIPWTIATIAMAVLAIVALNREEKAEAYSWYAVAIGAVLGTVLIAFP